MTFIVNRDADGICSVSYTESGVSLSVQGIPSSFTDALVTADAPEPLAPVVEIAAPAAVAAEKVDDAGPDNSQPFKCPGCGATYAEQVTCINGHAAIATLPTDEVLAGAAAPATDDSAPPAPAPPPPPAQEPAPAEAEQAGKVEAPTWPSA